MIYLYQSYEQHFLSFIACIESVLKRHDFSEGQVSFKDFTHWLGQLKVVLAIELDQFLSTFCLISICLFSSLLLTFPH